MLSFFNGSGLRTINSNSNRIVSLLYYQQTIADFCNYVIDKGYSIRFFPMEIKGSAPDEVARANMVLCVLCPRNILHLDTSSKCSSVSISSSVYETFICPKHFGDLFQQ